MMLRASERKSAYILRKLQKVSHCLPLAELRVTPGTVLIQASVLGQLRADWFLCQEAILKNNLQENVLQERNLSYVILQYFLKIMTLSYMNRSKLLRREKWSNHSKTAENHLKSHDFVWNYDCSLLNSIDHGISYPWYFIPSTSFSIIRHLCNHLLI